MKSIMLPPAKIGRELKQNRHLIFLLLIILLSGYLSFYGSWNGGYSNWFYSAAVKSMLQSWHNFFFVSFDPGGFITVDKPALGLWLQAFFALIFGFHGWSMILTESLSTIVSIILLYHLVQRSFGKTAGLISALVLALTPILEAVSRTNNLDASLIMVMLLATWASIVAAERGSFVILSLSMMILGLGYNIKTLEAFMILPALVLVYLMTSSVKPLKRVLHLTGALAILLVVSLSWTMIVDLTPANQRPYVGGSKNNSELELAMEYNGLQRVFGFSRMGALNRGNGPSNNNPRTMSSGRPGANNSSVRPAPMNQSARPGRGGRSGPGPRGGGPGGNSGSIGLMGGRGGILRVFNESLGGQISWLIPVAFLGILVCLLGVYRKKKDYRKTVLRHLLLWGMWLAPMLVFFDVARFYHPYYTDMLAPGIAALTGIGLFEMWQAYSGSGWKSFFLPAAFMIDATVQCIILSRYPQWGKVLMPVILGITCIVVLLLIGLKIFAEERSARLVKMLAAAGFAALLIAPAVWAYTPIMFGFNNPTLPYTGPNIGQMPSGTDVGVNKDSSFIRFLLNHRNNAKYLVVVPEAQDAAPIILATGQPVIAMGGFMGTDNALTAAKLEAMVKAGEVRYFEVRGVNGGAQSDATRWAEEHGKVVDPDEYEGAVPGTNNDGTTLYDLSAVKNAN